MRCLVQLSGVRRPAVLCAALLLCTAASAHAQQETAVKAPTKPQPQTKPRECPLPDKDIEIVGKISEVCIPVSEESVTTIHVPAGVKVIRPRNSPIGADFLPLKRMIQVTVDEDTPHGMQEYAKLEGFDYTSTIYLVASPASVVTHTDFDIEHLTKKQAEARARAKAAAKKRTDGKTRRRVANLAIERKRLEIKLAHETSRRKKAEKGREKAEEAHRQSEEARKTAEESHRNSEEARKKAEEARKKAEKARDLALKDRDKERQERKKAEQKIARTQKAAHETTRYLLIEASRRRKEQQPTLEPETIDWVRIDNSQLLVRFQEAEWLGEHLAIPVDIANPDNRPIPLSTLQIIDESDNPLTSYVLDPVGLENSDKGIITTIHEGQQIQVIVAAEVATDVDTDSLRLRVAEYGRPPVAAQIPRYKLVPETQADKQRRLWGKQVILGPSASYGACWFASGLEDSNDLEAASCTSVGAYLVKGFHQYLALEVEAVGAWTGDAQFEDAESDLTRSAKLGRFTALGVARLAGGETVPYLRLGIGLQVASYDSAVSLGEAPDSDTDLTSFFAFGGGVHYRLGSHLLARFDISYSQALGELMHRSLEVGLRVGYGWNP